MKSWWRRFRLMRRARAVLREVFADRALLQGTSLRVAHRSRVDLVDVEATGGRLRTIAFTILRHPRPYPFSSQHHEVMELYRYDLEQRSIAREKSVNLTRLKGRDGEPAGRGGF